MTTLRGAGRHQLTVLQATPMLTCSPMTLQSSKKLARSTATMSAVSAASLVTSGKHQLPL